MNRVTESDNRTPGVRQARHEIEPLVYHALAVLVLEISLLVIGLIAALLERVLPKQAQFWGWLETVDAWTALALVCMFAVYTLIRVGIRLYHGIAHEWGRA